MYKATLSRIAAAAVIGGSLIAFPTPAQAADDSVLHVKQLLSDCSDAEGSGTIERPFCTVGAAAAVVRAGQTVEIGTGAYNELVTITVSGTPDKPITFRSSPDGGGYFGGSRAGIVVDGQHDIRFEDIFTAGTGVTPAYDLRDSSAIILEDIEVRQDEPTASAILMAGVTDSSVTRLGYVGKHSPAVVSLDATTSGVSIDGSQLDILGASDPADGVGILVEGSGNALTDNRLVGFGDAGILLGSSASGTVVANNIVEFGTGNGIHNQGASNTAITNNRVYGNDGDGIRIDGGSAGVSVQNNVVEGRGTTSSGVEIGVYDGAVDGTVIDYNNVFDGAGISSALYAWGGTPLGLAGFRAASGQAAHDLETAEDDDVIDSANSAAPGFPEADHDGVSRIDDVAFANTGAGPVTYADRGARERIRRPNAVAKATLDLAARSVTVDASASTSGAGDNLSYEFAFGDGTVVTQATPVATHRYTSPGERSVTVKISNSHGHSSSTTRRIAVGTLIDTIGLYSLPYMMFVSARESSLVPLMPAQPALSTPAQFDLVDGGNGRVALFSRIAGKYVTSDANGLLSSALTYSDAAQLFTIVRNADGSVSLRSAENDLYVTTAPQLAAGAATIGAHEKFYQVKVSESARSVKAKANDRFVTAADAGVKPLIASRTAVGGWERFDVVDLGDSYVALFSHANRMFVTAEEGGAKPLIASRTTIGGWEKFRVVRHDDGTVSFKAVANGRYVTAEDGGAKPLIASRTTVGGWEKFTLG